MRVTSVFTNNRSQAVRLPADVRLPEGVKQVQVRARGVDRIISPVGHTDEFFRNGRASDDFMVKRASQEQPNAKPSDSVQAMLRYLLDTHIAIYVIKRRPIEGPGHLQRARRPDGDFRRHARRVVSRRRSG
jgi:antitoxin VapB